MKSLLQLALRACVLALCVQCLSVGAQGYSFADIPWESSATAVTAMLGAKGFKPGGADKDGDIRFEGELIGYKAMGLAMFVEGRLGKVTLILVTPDNKAREVYRDLRETLVQKYGAPTRTFETFRRPYYLGDGFEETAIKVGKASFATFWAPEGTEGGLSIEITERLNIRVTYEGPLWGPESNRRKSKSRSVF